MSDNLSKKIVRDTFEKSFDKEQFTLFIKNLLNHIDDSEEATFVYRGQLIPEVYRDSIAGLERIGKYTDPEGKKIELLIVNLKKENSLDRARTLQRNFVAWYLDGSRGGILKDAALVAFVSPDLNSWRFSLVKMDYKIQEAKVKKDLTPAKRFSFLVGSQEKSHTAQSRLVPIIEDDVNDPTLKQLEEAFNIEKVTKEFFEKYRELFIGLKESLDELVIRSKKIKDDFEKNNIDTTSFAKKLLGQIVFLYFLQKKGWFGVGRDSDWGTGPKNFLRELFDKKKVIYKNFFNDVLEPLFYEALAKKRDKDFYNHLNCKIPFLNGGLFDPINEYDWVYTDINIDNDLFSNEFKTKEGDIGTGILDVFDRYNFTVREDEPLEKEVAVDPEMLGKVFENLLEVKDRKSKGTYYTPREIVHYMCQESLINYLHSELTELGHDISKEDLNVLVKKGASFIHNDQSASSGKKRYEEQIPKSIKKLAPLIDLKLTDIKVCDPAVGSGAFLVGMMNEIINCREVLWSLLNDTRERDTYKFKSSAIQHSLYGVDIDPSAVEVAKLRLWLSLVVEEDDIKKIKPLPNLDYKIMQGNSLLEEFKGVKLFDEKLLIRNKTEEHDFIGELKQKEQELSVKLLAFYQKNPSWMKNRTISRPAELAEIEMEMDKIKASLKKNSLTAKELLIKPLQVGLNFLGSIGREDVWLKLKKLYSVYFKSYDIDKKKRIRNSIEKVIWELIETTIRDEGKLDTLKEIEAYKNNGIRPFFLWKLYFVDVFQEKGGFDVIIANPPYVGEKKHKNIFQEIKAGNLGEFYQKRMDLFYFFFHLAINIGKDSASISFITTNYYPTATGAKKLRFDLENRTKILKFINFNNLRIFESAQGQHNMISILQKGANEDYVSENCITTRKGNADSYVLQKIMEWEDVETQYVKVRQKDMYDGEDCEIRLIGTSIEKNDPTQTALNKIKIQGKLLNEICNINQGVVTSVDRVVARHLEKNKLDPSVMIGDGVFVLSQHEYSKMELNDFEKSIVKPWFKNSDIHKYHVNKKVKEYYIRLVCPSDKTIPITDFPSIYEHLSRFKKILETRKLNCNGLDKIIKQGIWWLIAQGRRLDFSLPKIVAPQRSNTNMFAFVESEWTASADVYFITQKDDSFNLKYILSLVNSKLYFLWLYNRGKRKGETLELYQKPLSEIPIKKISLPEQKPFIEIVDKILAITKSDDYMSDTEKRAKVKDYEKQIDQMVYKLYGLTKEEIEIVESQSR